MKIVFFGNNRVGWEVITYLKELGEELAALVVHPIAKAAYRDQIIEASPNAFNRIIEAGQGRWHDRLLELAFLRPEIGVSAFFGYRLPPEVLDLFPKGCINLHPALLPYNRGSYPNVWSIVDQTPAGATIHYMDTGIDTGDIIAQKKVDVELIDTGETLYRKLETACTDLFRETWPIIRRGGDIPRKSQIWQTGTTHRVSDVERLDEIDPDKTYSAKDLINILRARTFPPHRGAYIRDGRKRIYLSLQLRVEEDGKE